MTTQANTNEQVAQSNALTPTAQRRRRLVAELPALADKAASPRLAHAIRALFDYFPTYWQFAKAHDAAELIAQAIRRDAEKSDVQRAAAKRAEERAERAYRRSLNHREKLAQAVLSAPPGCHADIQIKADAFARGWGEVADVSKMPFRDEESAEVLAAVLRDLKSLQSPPDPKRGAAGDEVAGEQFLVWEYLRGLGLEKHRTAQDEAAAEAAFDTGARADRLILTTPAADLVGVAVKLRALACAAWGMRTHTESEDDAACVSQALVAVERLAGPGEQPHVGALVARGWGEATVYQHPDGWTADPRLGARYADLAAAMDEVARLADMAERGIEGGVNDAYTVAAGAIAGYRPGAAQLAEDVDSVLAERKLMGAVA